MYTYKEANFNQLVEMISDYTGATPASVFNLLSAETDFGIAEILGVTEADIDCIMKDEPRHEIAQLFGLNEAELRNLMQAHGKEIVIGMILGKLLTK